MPPAPQHHRQSIRLKGYDYTQPGGYFVTLATDRHQFFFGELRAGRVLLNRAGQVAQACWQAIPAHFANVALDAFIVMPNHVHGILIIEETDLADGAVGAKHASPLQPASLHKPPLPNLPLQNDAQNENNPPRGTTSGSISAIVQAYKSAVTQRINALENTPGGILWQRGFYEHILRDDAELDRIRGYILANPQNWETDEENPLRL